VLTLFYRASCPFSLAARLVLAEKGLPFVRRVLGPREQGPDIEGMSRGKIPALLDDSFGVFEAFVIAEYLEEVAARPALRPPDARGRAMIRMAQRRCEQQTLHPLMELEAKPRASVAPAERDRIVSSFTMWEHRMGDNGHLFGTAFSLVDAWLVAGVSRAALLGIELPLEFSRLSVWWQRMQERDSVRLERLVAQR
jgi:glutathione S-transferase